MTGRHPNFVWPSDRPVGRTRMATLPGILGPLDATDERPAFERIADQVGEAVRSNRIPRGKLIPNTGAIAVYYGVSSPTVLRALRLCADRALIVRQGRFGHSSCGPVSPSTAEAGP